MTTQECQVTKTLATEVYKSVNGMTPSYSQELLEVNQTVYPCGVKGASPAQPKLVPVKIEP